MNRDMVVKSITGCINNGEYCNECAYEGCIHRNGSCERDLLADALELIENLEERLAIVLEGQPEIVRCNECKFATCENCEISWNEIKVIKKLLIKYKLQIKQIKQGDIEKRCKDE